MSTLVGSGRSTIADTGRAAAEAVTSARRALGERKPNFGFLFAGPDHDTAELMRSGRTAADGAALLGCTTAGEFTEAGLTHGAVAALLVAADDTEHRLAFAHGLKHEHPRAVEALVRDFSAAQQ